MCWITPKFVPDLEINLNRFNFDEDNFIDILYSRLIESFCESISIIVTILLLNDVPAIY